MLNDVCDKVQKHNRDIFVTIKSIKVKKSVVHNKILRTAYSVTVYRVIK